MGPKAETTPLLALETIGSCFILQLGAEDALWHNYWVFPGKYFVIDIQGGHRVAGLI
ncbi:unnamed protein product [Acidithrix sp. C25]|nr:unnamed protein product [Acidithrix sp. C25]